MTLTQLRNESVTTKSRPFANKFNYARDMCHGTSISVKAIFEPGKSQKTDGLTKVLAGASMKTFVSDLGLAPLTRLCVILWSCGEDLTHIGVAARILVCSSFMGSTSSQPESQPLAVSQPQKPWEPIRLCGTLPTTVVPAERYVEQLWAALDQTLLHSKCGIGSDTPVGQGGTLNMDNYTIVGAPAPVKQKTIPIPPGVPPPPEYLPEMKDEAIVKNTIKALSPRIVAVHGPTGTGKSTVFPLAIAHWSEEVEGLKQGLTICAQPRRILAQQLCERVRSNRKMHFNDQSCSIAQRQSLP